MTTPAASADIRGRKWGLFGDGRAPIVVMSPTAEMTPQVWRTWLNQYELIVADPNWDGTHTPLQAEWLPQVRTLAELNSERGLVSTFWLEGDNDGADAGSIFDGWDELTEGTQRVFDELAGLPGRKILGISYDVHERRKQSQVDRWLGWCGNNRPPGWLFCARALPNIRYGGDVAAWEDHLPNLSTMDAILVEEIKRSGKRPVWNTERQRARNNGKGKDTTQSEMPGLIRIARRRNVGLIMGIQGPAGGVSDFGSIAPDDPERFREALLAGRAAPPPPPPPGDHKQKALAFLDAARAEIELMSS